MKTILLVFALLVIAGCAENGHVGSANNMIGNDPIWLHWTNLTVEVEK